LRRLDRSVHEMAREDLGLQSQLETASKSMTTKLEEILSPLYLQQSREESECGQHTGTDTASTTRSMFQKIFSSALHLKMLLLQTGQKYRADFVPTGARFSPDTMSLVGFESMELWQQSQGFAGRATAAPASPSSRTSTRGRAPTWPASTQAKAACSLPAPTPSPRSPGARHYRSRKRAPRVWTKKRAGVLRFSGRSPGGEAGSESGARSGFFLIGM